MVLKPVPVSDGLDAIPEAAMIEAVPPFSENQLTTWKHHTRVALSIFIMMQTPNLQARQWVVFDYIGGLQRGSNDDVLARQRLRSNEWRADYEFTLEEKTRLWLDHASEFKKDLEAKGYTVEMRGHAEKERQIAIRLPASK